MGVSPVRRATQHSTNTILCLRLLSRPVIVGNRKHAFIRNNTSVNFSQDQLKALLMKISLIFAGAIKPQHRLLSLSARGVVEIIFSACAQFCSLINGIQLFCLHFLPLLVFLTNSFTQHNHWNFQQFDRIKIF